MVHWKAYPWYFKQMNTGWMQCSRSEDESHYPCILWFWFIIDFEPTSAGTYRQRLSMWISLKGCVHFTQFSMWCSVYSLQDISFRFAPCACKHWHVWMKDRVHLTNQDEGSVRIVNVRRAVWPSQHITRYVLVVEQLCLFLVAVQCEDHSDSSLVSAPPHEILHPVTFYTNISSLCVTGMHHSTGYWCNVVQRSLIVELRSIWVECFILWVWCSHMFVIKLVFVTHVMKYHCWSKGTLTSTWDVADMVRF